MPPIKGFDPATTTIVLSVCQTTTPFAALAFKIAADPFVGKLAFFRVYSGSVKAGSYVLNTTTGEKSACRALSACTQTAVKTWKRCSQVRLLQPSALKPRQRVTRCVTPTTRCRLSPLRLLNRLLARRWSQRQKPTRKKMGVALSKLCEEDPTFHVRTDIDTNQTIISGMGELHFGNHGRPHEARVRRGGQRRQPSS